MHLILIASNQQTKQEILKISIQFTTDTTSKWQIASEWEYKRCWVCLHKSYFGWKAIYSLNDENYSNFNRWVHRQHTAGVQTEWRTQRVLMSKLHFFKHSFRCLLFMGKFSCSLFTSMTQSLQRDFFLNKVLFGVKYRPRKMCGANKKRCGSVITI